MENFNPKTAKIGNQVWMAENLAVDDGGEGIYKNPENNEYYYTYDAAMRIANSIPGWHLPSAQEWNEAALACGATGIPYYACFNPNLTDFKDSQTLKDTLHVKLLGFDGGKFDSIGIFMYFWTSTEVSPNNAYYKRFSTDDYIIAGDLSKQRRLTVRLVKNN